MRDTQLPLSRFFARLYSQAVEVVERVDPNKDRARATVTRTFERARRNWRRHGQPLPEPEALLAAVRDEAALAIPPAEIEQINNWVTAIRSTMKQHALRFVSSPELVNKLLRSAASLLLHTLNVRAKSGESSFLLLSEQQRLKVFQDCVQRIAGATPTHRQNRIVSSIFVFGYKQLQRYAQRNLVRSVEAAEVVHTAMIKLLARLAVINAFGAELEDPCQIRIQIYRMLDNQILNEIEVGKRHVEFSAEVSRTLDNRILHEFEKGNRNREYKAFDGYGGCTLARGATDLTPQAPSAPWDNSLKASNPQLRRLLHRLPDIASGLGKSLAGKRCARTRQHKLAWAYWRVIRQLYPQRDPFDRASIFYYVVCCAPQVRVWREPFVARVREQLNLGASNHDSLMHDLRCKLEILLRQNGLQIPG